MSNRMQSVNIRPVHIDDDVHHLFRWLGDEEVHRWYDEGEHSLEHYHDKFAPEPTTHKFVFEIEGQPAGYVQAYRLSDEPDYAEQLGLDHDAVSLDIFIGEPEFRGSGWGSVVLRAVLSRIVFGEMQAAWACINPDPENTRAVRSYEKSGLRGERVVWVDGEEPGDTGYELIMLLSREEFTRPHA